MLRFLTKASVGFHILKVGVGVDFSPWALIESFWLADLKPVFVYLPVNMHW